MYTRGFGGLHLKEINKNIPNDFQNVKGPKVPSPIYYIKLNILNVTPHSQKVKRLKVSEPIYNI